MISLSHPDIVGVGFDPAANTQSLGERAESRSLGATSNQPHLDLQAKGVGSPQCRGVVLMCLETADRE
jgi:hypothetical protein